jgi:hypothetical protein
MAARLRTTKYNFPYPASDDLVDVSGDIQLLATSLDTNIDEIIQDVVGLMVSNNTETGLSVTYDDTTGKMNLVLDNNYIQDISSQTLVHNNHSPNVIATYNNVTNQVSLTVTGGGGSGGSNNASLSDMWWLGV